MTAFVDYIIDKDYVDSQKICITGSSMGGYTCWAQAVMYRKKFAAAVICCGGGFTLSGGECLCQAEFCKQLLIECKNHGLNTAVDTCGNVPWTSIESVIPYTDTFLFDVKAIDDDIHIKCTGVSNKLILSNLKKLDEQGASIEIRIPYVPKFNACDIKNIAEFVNGLKNVKKVRVLPYHNYASGKYSALNMTDKLPDVLPAKSEIAAAQNFFYKR